MEKIGFSASIVFIQNILIMENRQLMSDCSGHEKLLPLIIRHLEKLPVESLHPMVKALCSSSLLTEFRYGELNEDSRGLLAMLCQRFLSHDINTVIPVDWLRLFIFIGDAEKLLAKIFSSSPEAEENIIIVKNLLASKEIQLYPYFA